ncbi:MAG: hypothetical protein ACTSWR_04595 [Candidatus Helarchaeota archaeon]
MVEIKYFMTYYSYIVILFNSAALVLNILPFMGILIIEYIATIFFLIVFFKNFGLVILNFRYINRSDHSYGRWTKNMSWIYILVSIISIFFLCIAPLMYSFLNINNVPYLIIAYIILFGIGILLAVFDLKCIGQPKAWK